LADPAGSSGRRGYKRACRQTIPEACHLADRLRRVRHIVHPRARFVLRVAAIRTGPAALIGRLLHMDRFRRLRGKSGVSPGSALGRHDPGCNGSRLPHSYLFDRLYACGGRLLQVFRLHEPFPVCDADPCPVRKLFDDVRRVGRRRALLVSTDWILLRPPQRRRRRKEGVHRQPHRRRRVHSRHIPDIHDIQIRSRPS